MRKMKKTIHGNLNGSHLKRPRYFLFKSHFMSRLYLRLLGPSDCHYLVGGHVADTHVRVREVGAQLKQEAGSRGMKGAHYYSPILLLFCNPHPSTR